MTAHADTFTRSVEDDGATYRLNLVHGRIHLAVRARGSRYWSTVAIPPVVARELAPQMGELAQLALAESARAA